MEDRVRNKKRRRRRRREERFKNTVQKSIHQEKKKIALQCIYQTGALFLPRSTNHQRRMHGLGGIITRCDAADGLLTVLTFIGDVPSNCFLQSI